LQLRKEANDGHEHNHRSTVDTARAFGDATAVAHAGGVAHPPRITDPGTISTNGDGEMMILADEAQLPFSGYDRLNAKQVKDGLSDHSQVELEAVESYERSHQDREAVLDKLRYLRGAEPLPGYDALDVEEILAALKEADLATLKRVRGYERKFANRPRILDDVARVHGERRATEPASAAPAYNPTSARALVGK
jgi:hypothetical protein